MVNFSFRVLKHQKLPKVGERKFRLPPSVNMDAVKSFIARFKKNRV